MIPTHPNTEKFLREVKECLDNTKHITGPGSALSKALSALEVALEALDRLEVGRFIDADNIARKAQAKIEEILK